MVTPPRTVQQSSGLMGDVRQVSSPEPPTEPQSGVDLVRRCEDRLTTRGGVTGSMLEARYSTRAGTL